MTWSQPICRTCWEKERPHDQPVPDPDRTWPERCCFCGNETSEGIWVIYRPAAVPYPTEDVAPGNQNGEPL